MGYQNPDWWEVLDQAFDFAVAEEAHGAGRAVVSESWGAYQHTVGLLRQASCSWLGRQGDLPVLPVGTLGGSHLSSVDSVQGSQAAQGSSVECSVVESLQGIGLGSHLGNLGVLDQERHVDHNNLEALAGLDGGTFAAASAAVAASPYFLGSLVDQGILAGQAGLGNLDNLADPDQDRGCLEDSQEVLQDHLSHSQVDTVLLDLLDHHTGTDRHNLVASSEVLGDPASAVGGHPVAAAPGPPTPASPSGRGLRNSGPLHCQSVRGPRSQSCRGPPGHPGLPDHLQKDLRDREYIIF